MELDKKVHTFNKNGVQKWKPGGNDEWKRYSKLNLKRHQGRGYAK
jgi:hypothetical protein